MNVSVVIPAHNEEENIPLLVKKIENTFLANKIKGEVVFVNDGSTDSTGKLIEYLGKKYKFLNVVHHKTKKGLSDALISGFSRARGDIIIFLPADLQSDPEVDIPKLLNAMKKGYDIVVGCREQWNRPKKKIIESKIYSFLCRKIFGVKLKDFNWIRAFRKDLLKDVYMRKDWHRYFVILLAKKGYKVGEVDVTEHPRMKGKTKFSSKRLITGFLDMIAVKFYITFSERPMLLFGLLGIAFLGIGILLGLYLFVQWLFGDPGIVVRPLFFLDVIFIISGSISFAIGFLAELIVSLREDLRHLRDEKR